MDVTPKPPSHRPYRRRPWRWLIPRGLVPRLIIALTAIVALVAGVSAFLDLRNQEQILLDQMTQSADQISEAIVNATWHAMLEDRRDSAYAIMRTVGREKGIEKVRIFNKEGRVVFSTGDDQGALVDKKAEACDLCHAAAEPLVTVDVSSRARLFRHPDGAGVLGMIRPVYNEPACSTAACHAHPEGTRVLGVLDVGMSLDRVDHERERLRAQVIVRTLVEIGLLALCIVLVARRFVSRPIRRLTGAIRSLGPGDLERPVGVDSTVDMDEPELSLHEMRERLGRAHAQLAELARDLERKVEERTAQLRSAHEQLAQAERMASLGRLAATVAHEVNNPVASVLNLSKLVQRIVTDSGIPPDRVPEVKRYLSLVVGETTRVGRIVQDLLMFSRQSRPRKIPVDLNALVDSTVSLTTQRFAQNDLVIRFEPGHVPLVSCDAGQVQQVLANLLSNAVEARRNGAHIRVTTAVDESGANVVLEVEDDGVGIAPEHLGRIFDPFFTTKAEGRALGLGLAVAYGIVQAHDGTIRVRSTPGQGTVFTVMLPIGVAESRGGQSPRGESP